MKRPDVRLRSLIATLVLVVLVAMIVQLFPEQDNAGTDFSGMPENTVTDDQVMRHFTWAVTQLRQGNYEPAINGFQAVLEQAPNMPEAYVNIGFAHIELKQYQQAVTSFNRAIDLRPNQFNAYWGLAVSLEGMCDIPAAIGAMRTYVHLAPTDDEFLVKANAALWEWEQIKTRRAENDESLIKCNHGIVSEMDDA